MKAKQAEDASTDPIYAAIEQHRAADAAYGVALDVDDAKDDDIDAADRVAAKALMALARTVPTTPAGVLAELDYILSLKLKASENQYDWNIDGEEVDLPAELLNSLRTAMARLV